MDPSEPTPSPALPPKLDEARLKAAPPSLLHNAPIAPPLWKRRSFLIIMLITVSLLILAAPVALTFFTSITTAEVLQIDEDIKLPVGGSQKTEDATAEYTLGLKWKDGKGVFRFMEKDYEEAQDVVAQLTKLKASVPNCRIIVRGDKNLPAVEIQRTMSALASAGFDSITFSTLNQE
jgi:biopolymer transport protein ExbD